MSPKLGNPVSGFLIVKELMCTDIRYLIGEKKYRANCRMNR